ncbi:hypothetical protein C8R45DRAFT_1102423 [Mycena sanguinolenta]|nr:hypothetical protein C8R45DRAFT_1102423 [Mycena sanguinolenta]
MEDPIPTIDFSLSGNLGASYSLEREDMDGMLRLHECRAALDKLVAKMDSLELIRSGDAPLSILLVMPPPAPH